jgi:hypothetical protein
VLGAVLSFSAAVALSVSSQPKKPHSVDDDEPLPNISVRQPSKDLGIATRRDLLPGAMPTPSTRLSDELDSLREARELGRSSAGPKKPPRPWRRSPRQKAPADLKDPFGQRGE